MIAFGCFPLLAQEVPRGTILEARLSRATSSSNSHNGDPVEATVIAPVSLDGRVLIPFGSIISGELSDVHPLGFGLKQTTASIGYRFDLLRLPAGERIPVKLQLLGVETAKEQVDRHGVVHGIHPIVGLSSGLSFCTVLLSFFSPAVSVPVWGIKSLIAPSANPEISFSAGTELVLHFAEPANIPHSHGDAIRIAALPPEKATEMNHLLRNTATQRAYLGARPSDWVNLAFSGARAQLDRAFKSAGWTEAHGRSPVSLYRMYLALTKRKGYPKAPMNALTLNGAPPTLVYQKSLDTVEKRHHVRLWKDPEFPNLWLGAAAEDIGFHFRFGHWTHSTNPETDAERAKVVNDLAFTGCVDAAGLLPLSPSVRGTEFRGPVTEGSDERIAALQLNSCSRPIVMPGVQSISLRAQHRRVYRVIHSFQEDLVRSNILFMTYNSVRALTTNRGGQIRVSVVNRQNLGWLPSSSTLRGDTPPVRGGSAPVTSVPTSSSQQPNTQLLYAPPGAVSSGNSHD